jgi:hypothetical protein
MIFTSHQRLLDDHTTEDKTSRALAMYAGEQKCTHDFGEKP